MPRRASRRGARVEVVARATPVARVEPRRALVRRARDHATSPGSGHTDGEPGVDALALWRALVVGELTVVAHFAAAGRRYLVLQPPPPRGASGGLSRREFLVAFLVARGYSNALIGVEIDVAPSTVATYLAKAMAKLGVSSRIELVRLFSTRQPRRRARRAEG